MEKLMTIYKNISLRKGLIVTIACSFLLAFISGLTVALISRPSYYNLIENNADKAIVNLHDMITVLLIIVCVCSSMIIGIWLYYRQKISRPLQVLEYGMEQIALNNLDFELAYTSEDELGKLCRSFEIMRVELLQNYKKMWRMAEERKRINASFAHDLRTPLTVLHGYVDFLQEYILSPDKKDEKILETNNMLDKYICRLEDYVEIMNQIQKLEDTPIEIKPIPINDFKEQLKNSMDTVAKKYGKEVVITDECDLQIIYGDVSLIFRVIENVTQNAFQYSKSKVWLRFRNNDKMIKFEVIDDGEGFSAEALKQALNPFYSSGQKNSRHFGLGLNICEVLCKNHGGSISICNTKDLGAKVETSFFIKSR